MEMTNQEDINKLLSLFKDDSYIHVFEFNYDIIELRCLKELIGEYIKVNISNTVYYSKNNKNKYYAYLITHISEKNKYILNGINEELANLVIKCVGLIIEIDIKNLKRVKLRIMTLKGIPIKYDQKLKESINEFYNKVKNDIELIIKSIKDKKEEKSGIIRFEGIIKKDVTGYFNSKYIDIDGGEKLSQFDYNGKKIKVHYKYNDYYIYTYFDKVNHKIEFYSLIPDIISEIFQAITLISFNKADNQEYIGANKDLSFFNKENKFTIVNNSKITIPAKIDKYFDNFFLFDAIKQNYFYRSCKSLNNAMKSEGIKSIFYTYQSLENIVAYYEKINKYPQNKRSENVKKILSDNFNELFANKVHKFWDDYRNKFAHNGIEEKELIELAIGLNFDTLKIIKPNEVYIEIVQVILINILKGAM